MKALLAALPALILPLTGAAAADAYQAQRMVTAILLHDYTYLVPTHLTHRQGRFEYMLGFPLSYDASCNVLPDDLYTKLSGVGKAVASNGVTDDPLFQETMLAGIADASAFLAKNSCQSGPGAEVKASLEHIWLIQPLPSPSGKLDNPF